MWPTKRKYRLAEKLWLHPRMHRDAEMDVSKAIAALVNVVSSDASLANFNMQSNVGASKQRCSKKSDLAVDLYDKIVNETIWSGDR